MFGKPVPAEEIFTPVSQLQLEGVLEKIEAINLWRKEGYARTVERISTEIDALRVRCEALELWRSAVIAEMSELHERVAIAEGRLTALEAKS